MLKKDPNYSILTGTCPKCQKESMYLDPNPLHLSKIWKCIKLQPLWVSIPDWTFFFYGAMYVSYGLNVCYWNSSIYNFVCLLSSTLKCLYFNNSFPVVLFPFVITMGEKYIYKYVCLLWSEFQEITPLSLTFRDKSFLSIAESKGTSFSMAYTKP
jgi:hypothetical protein